ncbi:iron-containing alcohol dehydrogenase [bacterium]|nr:iron-containing alcohol dehydrogenase [bacterium]
MSVQFYNPTRLFFGNHCVTAQTKEWTRFGKKALVVTGKTSAAKNGSLDDLKKSLAKADLGYELFCGVEPDPSFETVENGAACGRAAAVSVVVGVGGGSAIDAAKAMAVLMANPGMAPEQLYTMDYLTPALPIVAIPTTAGTGTEVTPYGVLTDQRKGSKRAFAGYYTFPQLALVDAVYTLDLPWAITLDTAIDALSHLLEGYISKKANVLTDTLAEKGLQIFRECMLNLEHEDINRGVREKLMLASTLGGMVIATAGTATVHALGYPLTYHKKIPHGRANGYLLTSQMKRCASVSSKANRVLSLLRLEHWGAFQVFLGKIFPKKIVLTQEEQKCYAAKAIHSHNHMNNPYTVTEALLFEMLSENFSKKK